MLLPPVKQNFLPTYFLDYQGNMGKHTLQFHVAESTVGATAIGDITALVNLLKTQVHTTTTFNVLRFRPSSSLVSLPVSWTAIAGTNTTAQAVENYPNFISFTGRAGNGRRITLKLFGWVGEPDADYRALSSESANISAIVNELNKFGSSIRTVDGGAPVWNPWSNQGVHAYFQRKARRAR